MGWEGLEPSTNALKGRCSTIELPTRVLEASGERYPSVVSEARGFRPVIFSLSLDRAARASCPLIDAVLLGMLFESKPILLKIHPHRTALFQAGGNSPNLSGMNLESGTGFGQS